MEKFESIETLRTAVYNATQKSLADTGTDPLDILAEIFYPFAGLDCPVIYSMGEQYGSAADTILQAILVHFAMPENLDAIPQKYREELPVLIGYLLHMMKMVERYQHFAYDCGNLHKINKARKVCHRAILNDFNSSRAYDPVELQRA